MKLISLLVVRTAAQIPQPVILAAEHDLSCFNYFTKGSVKESCIFMSRNIAKKASLGERSSVDHEDYCIHFYVKGSGLAGFAFTDNEYPDQSAHGIIATMLRNFEESFGAQWKTKTDDMAFDFPWLKTALSQYKNPREADKVQRTLTEIDAVKKIMHKNIEQAIGRGEELDALVSRSNDLSSKSKQFYKQSKKANKRCCVIQ